jgi:tRNA dimethylallyltransferase
MFQAGLVAEVRALWSAPRPLSAVAAQAVGYREVIAMLEGRVGLAKTMERIRARSRQFAKRQCTWFRGLVEVRPWPVLPGEDAESVAERLSEEIKADRVGSGIC